MPLFQHVLKMFNFKLLVKLLYINNNDGDKVNKTMRDVFRGRKSRVCIKIKTHP